MKPMHFAMALLSAAMFFVLAGVFMGVQLELDGTKLVVNCATHGEIAATTAAMPFFDPDKKRRTAKG